MSAGLPREQRLSIEARLAQTQKKWDEAATLYQTLWKSFPDELEYGLRVAQTQVAGGHAREALATVDSLRRHPVAAGRGSRGSTSRKPTAPGRSRITRARKAPRPAPRARRSDWARE